MRTLLLASLFLPLALAPACADRRPLAPAPPAGSIDTAPFTLRLEGERAPDGSLVLVAEVDLAWPLAAPLVLALELPPGAALREGRLRERVGELRPATTLTRRYRVDGLGAAPVRLVAEQRQGDLAGARAEETWPAPAEPAPPRFAPIAPVRVGGLVIGEAVPLTPRPEPRDGR